MRRLCANTPPARSQPWLSLSVTITWLHVRATCSPSIDAIVAFQRLQLRKLQRLQDSISYFLFADDRFEFEVEKSKTQNANLGERAATLNGADWLTFEISRYTGHTHWISAHGKGQSIHIFDGRPIECRANWIDWIQSLRLTQHNDVDQPNLWTIETWKRFIIVRRLC